MTRRASWVAVCMAVCALGFGASRASASAELTTIYLQNGGKLRGEIVMDVPGSPLTVVVAGQAIQVPRESIARIEGAGGVVAPAPAPAPYAAQPAPAPVAVAPAPAPAPGATFVVAPPPGQPAPMMAPAPMTAPTGPLVLQFDRYGRAAIDANWSPELQQLVARRNDASYKLKRKGLGAPISMLSLGALGIIITAAATTAAANNCVYDYDYTDYSSYDNGCHDRIAIGMGVGYTISSLLFAGGATFLMVRLLKKKSLKRQVALIDADLARFNVRAMAKVKGLGSIGNVAGLTLSTRF
jgi:hypothetical protein